MPSLPRRAGPAPNGNFVLNEFKVGAKPEGTAGKFKPVALHNAQADFRKRLGGGRSHRRQRSDGLGDMPSSASRIRPFSS